MSERVRELIERMERGDVDLLQVSEELGNIADLVLKTEGKDTERNLSYFMKMKALQNAYYFFCRNNADAKRDIAKYGEEMSDNEIVPGVLTILENYDNSLLPTLAENFKITLEEPLKRDGY